MKPIEDQRLPSFRSDIKLFLGPDSDDGSPTYTVYDSLSNNYWKISWPESLVMSYHSPGMTVGKLAQLINTETTCNVSEDEISEFFKQARKHKLLSPDETGSQLYKQWKETGGSNSYGFSRLLVRIPILRPDVFLAKTLPYVLFLVSKPALIFYTLLSVMGLAFVIQNSHHYFATFSYFFNFEGFLGYVTTIAIVKTIHEFSHAYTARYYGVSVPTMGVLIVVIWPMLYTDITNSWKLWQRKQRIAIASAGVAAELILAGITTFAWGITEPGILKSAFFLVSSATWVTSLLINLNPAVRFDGYLLLSDYLAIDNLQSRAFAVTRWKMINSFFGYQLECPEPNLTSKQINALFVYGMYTRVYRFFVYFYLAYFTYSKLPKIFGVLVSLTIIWNFIVHPFLIEFAEYKNKKIILENPLRFRLASSVLFVIFLFIAIPLPRTIEIEGITAPVVSQNVYVPTDSVVQKIYVEKGKHVNKGDLLIQLYSPNLESERAFAKSKVKELEAEIKMVRLHKNKSSSLKIKEDELQAAYIHLEKIETQIGELKIIANTNGTITNWKRGLRVGLSVKKGSQVFELIDEGQIKVVGFLPEKKLSLLFLGQEAEFCLNYHKQCISGKIFKISNVRTTLLDYPQMAAPFGGKLLTTKIQDRNIKPTLIESYYTVEVGINVRADAIGYGQRGYLKISEGWRSLLYDWMRNLYGVFVRESGI